MSKHKKQMDSPQVASSSAEGKPATAFFSFIQMPVDQGPPIPTQRILQEVIKDGEAKIYVSESAYFRAELMEIFANILTESYDRSIMKRQSCLRPVKGAIFWCRFTEDTAEGKRQVRVDPESFE